MVHELTHDNFQSIDAQQVVRATPAGPVEVSLVAGSPSRQQSSIFHSQPSSVKIALQVRALHVLKSTRLRVAGQHLPACPGKHRDPSLISPLRVLLGSCVMPGLQTISASCWVVIAISPVMISSPKLPLLLSMTVCHGDGLVNTEALQCFCFRGFKLCFAKK